MKKEDLFEAVGGIDDEWIEEVKTYRKRTFPWKPLVAAAACLALVLTAVLAMLPHMAMDVQETVRDHDNLYSYSDHKSQADGWMTIIELEPNLMEKSETAEDVAYCLVPMTARELFDLPTDIFEGEVLYLRYYEVNFGGVKHYYAVADIRVEQVYRGDLGIGDVARVKISSSAKEGNVMSSASGTVSKIKQGVSGIFMLNDYMGETQSDIFFDGANIITHFFSDGERFAFLETENGLVFHRTSYPAVAHTDSMALIREYVKRMSFRLGE